MEANGRPTVTWVPSRDVPGRWNAVLPFLKEAMEAGDGLIDEHDLSNELVTGHMDLFMVTRGNDICGAVVTQVMRNSKGNCLHVVLTGIDSDLRTLNEVRVFLEETAKDLGIAAMSWTTLDDRWFAYAARTGFRCRFVEFVKEF